MNEPGLKMFDELDKHSIAIVGMSGAFPGADDIDELWRRLSRGEELIRFLPVAGSNDESAPLTGKRFVPAVSAMSGVDMFDADFFGMTPAEAEITDPQHRILLEHAWRAM